jgi:proteic killer suppression protein
MEVLLSKNAKKQLHKAPSHIKRKLMYWISQVDDYGIEEVRKISGFHDEPLKGIRKGQRSTRLSKSWRAIYEIIDNIIVIEVHNHDY